MSTELLAFELTETNRDWLIHKPIEIAVYLVIAFVLRLVAHKMIDRMTQPAKDGDRPALLRPLQERTARIRGGNATDKAAAAVLAPARRAQRAQTIGSVLKSTVSIVVLTWCVLQVLGILGVNVAPFIASAGIVGVALGFGAQNLVRDFITGIFMLLEDQYGVGDVVDLGDAVGTVESVGLRVTTVRDLNGTLWYCRNGEIVRVGNMSQGYAVAVLDLPISHSSNIQEACEVALRAAEETAGSDALSADVLEPPELLGVNKVTAEGVMLRLTVRVRPGKQWAVQRRLNRDILAAFDAAGIHAPYQSVLANNRSANGTQN
ncbi:mechanosensitive ion channel family protein [Aldersonia kunmingensis]|uniref:mechanosensitive ion channel family protein n=1 Tax=Aldersonia kunmingensis TaxID=408066 RepID=UPI00082EB70C|nr:mechanosensitive ion channel family protein [Aldersonia kunmingensis]